MTPSQSPFAAVTETHISVVFFLDDRAYKLKKAERFAFIDLRDLAARERLCHREVELNRRISPDVYLGVAEVHLPDRPVPEPMVVMRRMPLDRRLATLVADDDPAVAAAIEDLAGLVARFHATADRSDAIAAAGTPDAVVGRWEQNFAEMRTVAVGPGGPRGPDDPAGVDGPNGGLVFAAEELDATEAAFRVFAAGRRALFDARLASGAICDGHGDLQLADVFVLDDGVRVLDCIEFDDELRHVDVADDVAFLVMDLRRAGRDDLADQFLRSYEAAAGSAVPRALVSFYVAYRAQVRAKVTALRAVQLADDPAAAADVVADARALLSQCRQELERIEVRCVVVGGLPGTGKSTLARRLADRLGFELLRSDVLRSDVLRSDVLRSEMLVSPTGEGDDAGESGEGDGPAYGVGRYRPEATDAVYQAMFEKAEMLLSQGRSVVLDASFASATHRRRAADLAARTDSRLVELQCVLDPQVAAARIRARLAEGIDASEATSTVAATMAQHFDPWPSAREVPTATPLTDTSLADPAVWVRNRRAAD